MNTIQGFILIDVEIAALNNAGKDDSSGLDNAVKTKKIRKNNKDYAYVSGQAWRYWWRETLRRQAGWQMSPVIREKKIAFTEADPFTYPDDDLFGYMRAGTVEVKDAETGKTKKENITLTRTAPLKNSALIACSYNPIIKNWASMTRQEGDAVPYNIDEYCAVMKGMFSLDLDMAGTFSMYNKTGYVNINEEMKKAYLEKGAVETDDPLLKDQHNKPYKLVRVPKEIREQRVKDTINALKYLSGGAKQTTNMADVTPKLIILARFKSGNHPFSHIVKDELDKTVFSAAALEEVINDYKEQFTGSLFIGRRKGFMDDIEDSLQNLAAKEKKVKYGSVNEMIDAFVQTITLD